MEKTKKNKLIIIIIAIILILMILLFIVAPFCLSISIYDDVFGTRYTTYEPLAFSITDFDGLKSERYEFSSNNGQKLVGYRYYVDDKKPKAVIIFAHGFGGGGHNSYMDSAYFFASNGYNVFAYDATGNDESEGESTNGLPQGVIDLDYAIDFVENLDALKNLPIMLFGHSWGGYSVCNVLNFHHEVKAVVSLAGFNKSSDLIKAQGEAMVGSAVYILMPFINTYENMKFDKYAKATAMDGFANTDAGVFIVHSKDDTTVPIQYGYDVYYEKYADDERFTFLLYENKGHSYVYCSTEALEYIKEFNKNLSDYFADKEATAEAQAEYIKQHLDRNVWRNLLDMELYQNLLAFYDGYLS